MKRFLIGSVLVIVCSFVLVLAGVWVSEWTDTPQNVAAAPAQKQNEDASAWVGCRDFARMMRDVQAGVLNEAEMRTAAQEVRTSTRLSTDGVVKEAGDALVRTITHGTTKDVTAAIVALNAACASHR